MRISDWSSDVCSSDLTLRRYFENDAGLADVGGARYLVVLAASAFNIIDAEDYGRTLHDLYLRRRLIELGEDVVNEAYGADPDSGAEDRKSTRLNSSH